MTKKFRDPAERRYLYRFLVAMACYTIFLIAAKEAFPRLHPSGAPAYALAILPAVPIIAVIAVVGLYIGELKDEFQRSMLVQAMIWGIGVTLAATTAWGFLELFSLAPHVPLYMVFPVFCVFAGIAQGVLKLRYR
ncbi:MAG TPA: hypothetical protein VFI20_03380 [Terracidiphilus sp.]|nr:hypothetical protein [Terracidiphilus sp.]